MQDRKLTPDMVPVIKLARKLKYNYARIASYFEINQGRIADVMKGRRFPEAEPFDLDGIRDSEVGPSLHFQPSL